MDDIQKIIKENTRTIENLRENISLIRKIVEFINNAFMSGNKILIAGNGGSAADAQHFAAELVGKFKKKRIALPAIALNTNTSIITAVSNDDCFANLFARQLEALAAKGDIFVGLSTSGNSQNIINALDTAKRLNCKTIGLTGEDGGLMNGKCDILIKISSTNTPRIQEAHILTIHIICELIENLFSNEKKGC